MLTDSREVYGYLQNRTCELVDDELVRSQFSTARDVVEQLRSEVLNVKIGVGYAVANLRWLWFVRESRFESHPTLRAGRRSGQGATLVPHLTTADLAVIDLLVESGAVRIPTVLDDGTLMIDVILRGDANEVCAWVSFQEADD